MSRQGHESRHRVLVVGGGFGGLQAALKLSRADVEVTLVDRRNFHLFQPLAYQVATGGLSPGEIAYPLRAIFKRRPNVRVLLGEVTGVDLDARRVTIAAHEHAAEPRAESYDTLVVAGGSQYSYFGHEEWAGLAPELKSMESLLTVRRRILGAFEAAELETDEALRRAWLTFVVVGGGPTGVEMAGQIGEIARDTLKRDFREIDPREARILLAEASDRLLTTFPPSLSAKAERSLSELGVTTLTGHLVTGLDDGSVTMTAPNGEHVVVQARTAIWAAGVTASPLARMLGEASGAELDAAGRLAVGPELTLPGHSEVFAIGDMVRPPKPVPGVAPAAMQEGRYAAKAIRERLQGREPRPFRYVDKGNVATIGRARAVADLHGLHLSGFPAWVFWLALHLYYLIGFENRVLVLIRWLVGFVTRGRGARLITGDVTAARGERPVEHTPV
jgi:NADH dehydrogenase